MTSSSENNDKIKRVYNDRMVDDKDVPVLSIFPAYIKKNEDAKKKLEKCRFPERLRKELDKI